MRFERNMDGRNVNWRVYVALAKRRLVSMKLVWLIHPQVTWHCLQMYLE